MRLLASISLLFLLGAMFVGLFNMSMGMNMTGEMSDCPFMSHEETWCPMDLADHIEAWRSAFLAVVPTTTLLFWIIAILLVVTLAPQLLKLRTFRVNTYLERLRERRDGFIQHYLQELFSRGILNPKLF